MGHADAGAVTFVAVCPAESTLFAHVCPKRRVPVHEVCLDIAGKWIAGAEHPCVP